MNAPTPKIASFARLEAGDPVPRLQQRTSALSMFAVDAMAGRYLVFCCFGSMASPPGAAAVAAAMGRRDRFDDKCISFFGVSVDPQDETEKRVADTMPGVRFLWDFDARVSRAMGAVPTEQAMGQPSEYRQCWVVVDPSLHVLATFPITGTDGGQDEVFEFIDSLPHPSCFAGFEVPPPILILPNVFDLAFCRQLIDLYDGQGGMETGVVRNGAGVIDRSMKSRKDVTLIDPTQIKDVQMRISRKVIPEIRRIFFTEITRMERYMVGCYAAEDGGHFRPHRDNTDVLTAHRRFAVSINLNGDFEGGEVSFPEYNPRGYKAPPGWAVIFPCNVLHAVSRVTSGKRYAFLPFVYDEAGSRIREENLRAAQVSSVAGG